MMNYNERIFRTDTPEYDGNFWDTMCGSFTAENDIHCGLNRATGAFVLPSGSNDKYEKAIKRESIFRNIATVVKAYNGGGRIFASAVNVLPTLLCTITMTHFWPGKTRPSRISWALVTLEACTVFFISSSHFNYC